MSHPITLSHLTEALQRLTDSVCKAANALLRPSDDRTSPDVLTSATAYIVPDVVETTTRNADGTAKVDTDGNPVAPTRKERKSLSIPKLNKKQTGRKASKGLLLPVPASFLLSLPEEPTLRAAAFVAAVADALIAAQYSGDAAKALRASLSLTKPSKQGPQFLFPAGVNIPKAWEAALKFSADCAAPEAFLLALKVDTDPTRIAVECPSNETAETKNDRHYSCMVPIKHVSVHLPGGTFADCPQCGRPFVLYARKGVPYVPPAAPDAPAATVEHFPHPDAIVGPVSPEAEADAFLARRNAQVREAV